MYYPINVKYTAILTVIISVLPFQKIYAQAQWDRSFDGNQPLPVINIDTLPVPASDVEIAGPYVTLLLNADQSNQRAPIWPGYSVFGQPILIYEAGIRSFLLAHPNPPAGYSAVFSSPQTVFEKQGPISDLNFPFQYHRTVNNVDTFAYRYEPGEKPDRAVRTIIHERFHVYQAKGFANLTYNRRTSEPDAEDLALAALEQKTLKSALKAGDPADSSRFVRQFLAVRAERYSRQPDSRDQEIDEERLEGMAEYLEDNLMNRPEVAPKPGGVITKITARLDVFPTIDDMGKGRYYATGAAQGLLLDLGGSSDWKERVSAGASLRDMVALSYPLLSGTEQALLAEAKSAHGYSELFQTGTQVATEFQSLKARAISEYDSSPGIEWTVPVPWDKDTNFGFSGSKPDYKLNESETLMPNLYLLDVSAAAFTLHFANRPAVLGSGVRFHAAAAAELLLNGKPFTLLDGSHPFVTLSLTEAGLNLSISKSGTLTVMDRKAVISYRERSLGGKFLWK